MPDGAFYVYALCLANSRRPVREPPTEFQGQFTVFPLY